MAAKKVVSRLKKTFTKTVKPEPEPKKPEPAMAPVPEPQKVNQPFGPGQCDVCGNPIAIGQTWVCKDHIRTN